MEAWGVHASHLSTHKVDCWSSSTFSVVPSPSSLDVDCFLLHCLSPCNFPHVFSQCFVPWQGGSRQVDLCEFEDSQVYIERSCKSHQNHHQQQQQAKWLIRKPWDGRTNWICKKFDTNGHVLEKNNLNLTKENHWLISHEASLHWNDLMRPFTTLAN